MTTEPPYIGPIVTEKYVDRKVPHISDNRQAAGRRLALFLVLLIPLFLFFLWLAFQ
jgi:hypothetical protein